MGDHNNKFVPPTMLRVLLVEPDDSTRHIISALLRNCGYKVAAVRDGLKAWETLKNKSLDIDLVLTEVDLPSISGFSLLTQIMDHHNCKNIPLIMMSSQDSVSTVFKFMLNGAVDFLIKPVRRNELRNLWQHVWRRNTTDNSIKYERESAEYKDVTGEKSTTIASKAAGCDKISTGLRLGQNYDYSETENRDEVLGTELSKAHPHINTKIHQSNNELEDHSAGAIDLMATFDKYPKNNHANCSFSGGNTAKFDFDTQFELSLQRDSPGSPPKPTTEERQILNHSNASAFSWYGSSMVLQPLFPTKSSHESQKLSENINTTHHYDGKKQKQENITYLVIGQSGQVDTKCQLEFFPATGATSDNKSMEHNNVLHSMFNAQSGMHPTWTPKSVFQKESSPFPTSISSHSNPKSQNSEPHHWSDDATYTCDQSNNDFAMHESPSNGQSCTSFYHDAESHNASGVCEGLGSVSDGNAPSTIVGKNNLESSMNNDHHDGLRDTSSHRTSQREAALTKFRLKRKDRCYDKKVRYESRKRQAENRPRVKGQFVRQVQGEVPVAETRGY
ncbi:two-component response regulator-like APRR5 isoform X3 [Medicago truncatula]|uniref:PRR response regulator n=1 Tax=Medicago truncatula TaxID=3880 RepID=A0A072UFZ2_MEDTR|nr:two-component response regulator-like APRR5 isoform X3 [Medicago truncatula]KEH24700.1 PRR response regulator [Medicago truncatula]